MDEDEGEGEGAARQPRRSKGKKKSKSKVQEGGGEPGRAVSVNGDSDSSDGQAEKCPICLLSFKKQQIATPESCDHSFCLDCLLEWSKNINTCPVDRQTFAMILVKKKFGGKVENFTVSDTKIDSKKKKFKFYQIKISLIRLLWLGS